jgi:DNA-binding NarL/FixJ family response regulator
VRFPLPSGAQAASAIGAAQIIIKPVFRDDLEEAINGLNRAPRRVLVVASDPDLVRLFRRLLRQRAAIERCYESFSPGEATEIVKTLRPDLVIVDLSMADGHSRETVLALSHHTREVGGALIVVSDQEHDYLTSPLNGDISFLKPEGFGLDELLRAVATVLSVLGKRSSTIRTMAPVHQSTTAGSPAW